MKRSRGFKSKSRKNDKGCKGREELTLLQKIKDLKLMI